MEHVSVACSQGNGITLQRPRDSPEPGRGWKKAIGKDKLSVSQKWSCYQTANHSPRSLWIFKWGTKNSLGKPKQLWQLKLPGNQESTRTMMKRSPVNLSLILPRVYRGKVSDLFYPNMSSEKSDLSLQFREPISPQISCVILNSLKCNDL